MENDVSNSNNSLHIMMDLNFSIFAVSRRKGLENQEVSFYKSFLLSYNYHLQ